MEHSCPQLRFDGAITLANLFYCIGLDPVMKLGHGHYWIEVKCEGKTWYCDQSGAEGSKNWRTIGTSGGNNNVWKGTGDGSTVSWK